MNITTDWKSPQTTGQNTSQGNINWENADNIKVEDGVFSVADNHSGNHAKDVAARIIKGDGTIGSSDFSNPNWWDGVLQYALYEGGLWGETLTPAVVNSANFGFALRIGGGYVSTYFLLAKNFGFAIPTDATIVSVTVKVKRKDAQGAGPGGTTLAYVDHVALQIVYSTPEPPLEYNTLPRKDFRTGYNCFLSQYIHNKAIGKTPWKTPTTLY